MRISTTGAHLIENFEGFVSHPYLDVAGVWTIGFGSTKDVSAESPCVTRAQAERRMMTEIDNTYGNAINTIGLPLNQNQFDALTSFVYNVGVGGVASTTSVGKALRAQNWRKAADALLAWDKADGRTLPGLTRRRWAERALFLQPDRWAGYTDNEIRWIREYDQHPPKPRRLVLRYVMRRQAKRIRALPRTPTRTKRLKSLEARS